MRSGPLTSYSFFQAGGPSGPAWRASAGAIIARDAGDTAYVPVRGLDPVGVQDFVTLGYLTANQASSIDLLLAAEPVSSCTYANTFTSGKITQELWTRTGLGTLLRQCDYTYTSAKLTQEVRKVFAVDGVTIIGQLTIAYVYSGSTVQSATYTRNV